MGVRSPLSDPKNFLMPSLILREEPPSGLAVTILHAYGTLGILKLYRHTEVYFVVQGFELDTEVWKHENFKNTA